MDIYIKPVKKVKIVAHNKVYIRDVAEIVTESTLAEHIRNTKILTINSAKEKSFLISVLDIIAKINACFPGHTVNNVGETDTVIEFSPKSKPDNKLWLYAKVAFVTLVLLFGSATAIMSFHSDAQMATVFENYYYIFFNEKIKNPAIVDLPYSIGLAIGIIVFFNHFSGKKITNDPTPIEVEMSLYESEVTDNIIDTLNSERLNKDDN